MPQRKTNPEAQRLAEYAARLHAEAEDARREAVQKSRAVQDALLDAWNEGASPTEMADMLGVGRVRIYQLMDKAEARREGREDVADLDG